MRVIRLGELVSAPPPATPDKPITRVVRPEPIVEPKKPVIYLRPDATSPFPEDIAVTVTMASAGRLHEVWPTPHAGAQPAMNASLSWKIHGMKPGSCAAHWGPKVTDPPCSSLDRPDACEAAEFESWVPESAVCLDVGGVPAPALLYNGFLADAQAPIQRSDKDPNTFKNVSAHPIGLVLIRRDKTEAISVFPGVAAGAEFNLNATDTFSGEAMTIVAAELAKRGLTSLEAADFMRAWTPLLQDTTHWSIFAFLEPAAIEAVSTLSFEPAPQSVTRVMAFAVMR